MPEDQNETANHAIGPSRSSESGKAHPNKQRHTPEKHVDTVQETFTTLYGR
jgi:hypothetical protein